MSAFICDPEQVAIVAAYTSPAGQAGELAEVLMRANIASVMHRYPNATPADRPGPNGYDTDGELIEAAAALAVDSALIAKARRLEPVQIIKFAQSLEYQSCELPSWDGSPAARAVAEVIAKAIRALPGYEAASWSI